MKTSSKLPKRSNAASGQKAHNESQFIKIGRVRLHSWINEKLPAADILISEREINGVDGKETGLCNKISPPDELGQAA